ncbi:MAG: hypothetical protein Q9157_005360, partial [Trypethelium eluteriae]
MDHLKERPLLVTFHRLGLEKKHIVRAGGIDVQATFDDTVDTCSTEPTMTPLPFYIDPQE